MAEPVTSLVEIAATAVGSAVAAAIAVTAKVRSNVRSSAKETNERIAHLETKVEDLSSKVQKMDERIYDLWKARQ